MRKLTKRIRLKMLSRRRKPYINKIKKNKKRLDLYGPLSLYLGRNEIFN